MTLCLAIAISAAAQVTNLNVSGIVVDETGEPVAGANVFLKNRAGVGTSTDSDGKFALKASKNDILVVTYIGYENEEILIQKDEPNLQIQLKVSETTIDEVVVVGMGSQRKISNVAAVTSVDVSQLQVPTSSVANLLGGRVAGVISTLTSGEPGKNITEFWVRGKGTFGYNDGALVLIDDLEGDINSIDPADIETFSVLKDASATAVYGARGANGVILVTTKRGKAGKLQIDGRVNYSVSRLKRLPDYLGGYDYARLANEAKIVRGESPLYNNTELFILQNGLDPDMYPDVNWQDEILNPTSFRQSYFASGRGGGEAATYYISLGGALESAAYRQDKSSVYSSNVGRYTYNYRTNLDMNLTKTTKLSFGSDGYLNILNSPGGISTSQLWSAQANLTPTLMPTVYSTGQYPTGSGSTGQMSPWVMINYTGNQSQQSTDVRTTLRLNQDFSFITEGLSLTLMGAYQNVASFNQVRSIRPEMYRALGRSSNGELILKKMISSSPATYSQSTSQTRTYTFEGHLDWQRSFGDHRTSFLLYMNMADGLSSNDATGTLSSIPRRNLRYSSRITYDYKDTYMINLNAGLTGSENFEPGHQFGFFPSISIGWVPTQYDIVTEALPFLSFFKIRASYGRVGNDQIASSRFPYLTQLGTGSGTVWGGSTSMQTVNVNVEGADNLVWETSTKADAGLEVKLFNNKLELTIDVFKDTRDGIFQQREQVPQYVGLTTRPYGNVGQMYNYGSDGNFQYIQDFGPDYSVTLRGNYSLSNTKVTNWEELYQKYAYQERNGWPLNIQRGFQSLGLFKDEEDIRYSPTQSWNTVMPGDIKYRDVNGDGKITDDDKVPLSLDNFPVIQYGFGTEFRYKKLTLGLMFAGRGNQTFYRTSSQNGLGWIPFSGGETGNVLSIVNDPKNRWIPLEYCEQLGIDPKYAENPNAMFPRLYYGDNVNNRQISDFWKGNGRYLRLSEVNLNYNLRHNSLRRIGIQSVDLQLIGTNMLVWGKEKLFDPEQAHLNGVEYPLPATYSLQLYIHL